MVTIPRPKRTPKPLDSVRLNDLALHYVARFATSAAKLEAYLARKLRERGWDGEGEAPVAAVADNVFHAKSARDFGGAVMAAIIDHQHFDSIYPVDPPGQGHQG